MKGMLSYKRHYPTRKEMENSFTLTENYYLVKRNLYITNVRMINGNLSKLRMKWWTILPSMFWANKFRRKKGWKGVKRKHGGVMIWRAYTKSWENEFELMHYSVRHWFFISIQESIARVWNSRLYMHYAFLAFIFCYVYTIIEFFKLCNQTSSVDWKYARGWKWQFWSRWVLVLANLSKFYWNIVGLSGIHRMFTLPIFYRCFANENEHWLGPSITVILLN